MLVNIGSKVLNATHLGQKAKSVVKKVGKVAVGSGLALGGIAAFNQLTGGQPNPSVRMVRTRGGLERAIRGGNR